MSKITVFLFLSVFCTSVAVGVSQPVQPEKIADVYQNGKYPFWGEYHKTPIAEIKPARWTDSDTLVDGWDWSLPDTVMPACNAYLCIARNSGLGTSRIQRLPKVSFPCNPVVSHWVKWRDLEPEEGRIDFQPLINNIEHASQKGYGSIVRLHFSAIDFAPDWIKKYNIPIRKERSENPKKTNYDVSHPEFHSRYIKFIKALGGSGIPQLEEVKGLYLGYASPSNGDEGIGPYPEGDAEANDRIPHVIERIDAWAEACKGVEHKVFMGGLSNYGFSKGFGIRRGFVEMYLYHIPDEHIGQKLDSNNYMYVDESNPVIAKNLFQGEENEEYEEKWIRRFGPTASFPYRYFTSNLRLLQMRCTYTLFNSFSLVPDMLAWVGLEMGRTRETAPDAWCFLRESYLKAEGGRPVKNFERWIYQRDIPGYETKPAIKIEHPIEMWMVQPGKYYDYMARQGSKIGFDVDDTFASSCNKFAVKISYIDLGTGSWSLCYQGRTNIESREVVSENTGKLKTATFFIETDYKNKTMPCDLEIRGENSFEPTVSFLRIVKM